MVLETPQLLLDGRRRAQTPSDVSQNPRQRAQLRYGGLQEGIFTLGSPCVRVCVWMVRMEGGGEAKPTWWQETGSEQKEEEEEEEEKNMRET